MKEKKTKRKELKKRGDNRAKLKKKRWLSESVMNRGR